MCQALVAGMPERSEDHPGSRHLEITELRAHLSYLSGDYVSATVHWTRPARQFHARHGTDSYRTRRAAGNATASWARIDDADRARHLPTVLSMLCAVASAAHTARARLAPVARLGT
jgi:hypothetical protein